MPPKKAKLKEGLILSLEWKVGSQHANSATRFGNGAHVIVPKEWAGKEVLCILKQEKN